MKFLKKKNKHQLPVRTPVSDTTNELLRKLSIIFHSYNQSKLQEIEVSSITDCLELLDPNSVNWIDIIGTLDSDMVKKLGDVFKLHSLVVEDIQSRDQRLKIDYLEDYLYIVLKSVIYKNNKLLIEQISIILGKNFLLSFQESDLQNLFKYVKERLKTAKTRLRRMGTDYLAYALIDAIIDNYFILLEQLEGKIELLEEEVVTVPSHATLQTIYQLKTDVLLIRKSIWPLKEAISVLSKTDSELIEESTIIYIRDVYDHISQVIDTLETFREMLTSMLDIYFSSISTRMNEVMKVLTIIATIFIPLTFIVGIYGMNFKNMPELEWRWGYLTIIIVMTVIALMMIIYFKRKKWI